MEIIKMARAGARSSFSHDFCTTGRFRRKLTRNPNRDFLFPSSPDIKIAIKIPTRNPRNSPPNFAGSATEMMSKENKNPIQTPMKLLFVEMGVGYDQHGQDITAAAMRACRDAISSNSIPAFRSGSIPGVNTDQMKLQIKLGVPHSIQQSVDIERVKSVFPYGQILNIEIVDGGMICSSGVCLEAMGDKNDDCYIVNAAVIKLCLQVGQMGRRLAKRVRFTCGRQSAGERERDKGQ